MIHICLGNILSPSVFTGIRNYEKESSRGDQLNTCRISPYLHFGQISPRTVLSEGRYLKSPKFLRKLAWRDLSYWLLSVFPDLPYAPTRPQYQVCRYHRIGVYSQLLHYDEISDVKGNLYIQIKKIIPCNEHRELFSTV